METRPGSVAPVLRLSAHIPKAASRNNSEPVRRDRLYGPNDYGLSVASRPTNRWRIERRPTSRYLIQV